MLKERKLKHKHVLDGYYYGYCKIRGFDGYIYGIVQDNNIIKEINGEEYYFAEVKTSACDSDYHSFYYEYGFEGVFLNFYLNIMDTTNYSDEDKLASKTEIINIIELLLEERGMVKNNDDHDVDIAYDCLKITLPNRKLDSSTLKLCNDILYAIKDYYSNKGPHFTKTLVKNN